MSSHAGPERSLLYSHAGNHDVMVLAHIKPHPTVSEERKWQASTLTFSISARMGIISTPIKGTVDVTDRDLTIDVDLGLLERLIPTTKARDAITSRVRGLLT